MAVLLLLLMLPTLLNGQLLTTTALVGEDVSLSYDPELSTDLTETPVKCYTDKMIGTNYFVFKKDKPPKDNSKRLNPAYRGRTRLSDEDLKSGIVSLRLYNVTRADEDNYYFVLPTGRYKIQLLIGAVSSAAITLEECPDCSGLVLRCESVGWYPPPQLSWWTDGGLPLPAVTMNTIRDPTGLYTISSTVVVERGQGAGNYTCSVYQERFNQTREAEIALQVLSPCYRGSSGCLMAVLLLLLMLPTLLNGQLLTTTALVGEDVSLSYDLELSTDLTETPLKCYTEKMIRTNDFVFKKDKPPKDNSKRLNPAYRGRTSLSDVDLKKGIVSLRLYNVTRADEDNYYFVLPSGKYKIQLLIGAVSSAAITLEERPDCSGLVLRCESVGWYPPPQLSWWTDGGLPLPAVTMNTTWDPTGLYTISSTVVVESSQGARNYSCRVHQERFNQTREAVIALQENQFPSCPHHHLGLVAFLAISFAALVLVVLVLVVIACRKENCKSSDRNEQPAVAVQIPIPIP